MCFPIHLKYVSNTTYHIRTRLWLDTILWYISPAQKKKLITHSQITLYNKWRHSLSARACNRTRLFGATFAVFFLTCTHLLVPFLLYSLMHQLVRTFALSYWFAALLFRCPKFLSDLHIHQVDLVHVFVLFLLMFSPLFVLFSSSSIVVSRWVSQILLILIFCNVSCPM